MPTVLIIEDEAKMRRLLELSLGEDGFTTLSASNAEDGLKFLGEETVDLIVTDLKLPGIGGLEFLQAAKRLNSALRRAPVAPSFDLHLRGKTARP